jgi:hypothetical protein
MALSKIEGSSLDIGQLGGRRNLLVNGGFDVWQRGTVPDRWHDIANMNIDTSVTTHLKFTTATGDPYQYYFLEDVGDKLVGKQVTLSLWAKAGDGNHPIDYVYYYGPNSGQQFSGSGFSVIDTDADGFTRYSVTFILNDNSVYNESHRFRFEWRSAQGVVVEVKDVQLELGDEATPFEIRSYAEELQLCQRYFQKPGADYDYIWAGDCTNGQTYYLRWTLPVTMRATPTFTSLTAYYSRFASASYSPRNKNVIQITAYCNSTGTRGYFEGTYQLDAEL